MDSATSTSVVERPVESAEGSTLNSDSPQPQSAHNEAIQNLEEKPSATEDFATALESFTTETEEAAREDNVIKGTVLKITPTHVVVDIGAKSEGMLPIAEVMDHSGKPRFQPGDEIAVMRDKGETEEGYINLSHQKAQRLRAWDEIEKAHNEKKPIKAVVIERIKGGLTVDILGAQAFLPGSQADLRPLRNLDVLKGETIEVAVIKLNKKRGNIVVSRKQLMEEEQNEKKSKTLEHLEEGTVLTGVVKNLTEYGAFVDLGGIDGLLHITDMSWGRLTHPRDLVNVGDQIQVKVLQFDKDKQRVSTHDRISRRCKSGRARERPPRGRTIHVSDAKPDAPVRPGYARGRHRRVCRAPRPPLQAQPNLRHQLRSARRAAGARRRACGKIRRRVLQDDHGPEPSRAVRERSQAAGNPARNAPGDPLEGRPRGVERLALPHHRGSARARNRLIPFLFSLFPFPFSLFPLVPV